MAKDMAKSALTLKIVQLIGMAISAPVATDCSAQKPSTATRAPAMAETAQADHAMQPSDGHKQQAGIAAGSQFDGEWFVEWCDKTKPNLDCGGFSLSLVQKGERLCGAYEGARVGLSQVDEGGRVAGMVQGNTANLTVTSERSGGEYSAVAMIDQDRIHWKLDDTLHKANQDIDIVAIDDVLDRKPLEGDAAARHEQTALDCQAEWDSR